jgi:hypothetical protein
MQFLILIIVAFVLGYWLSHSIFKETIDTALQKPKTWWQRLFRGTETKETTQEQSNLVEGKEE